MYYARVMAVRGATVDRRTNNHKTEAGRERAIRREVKRMPNQGPFLIERYAFGMIVSSGTDW